MRPLEIRKKYLEFFKSKNHTIAKSDSIVPSKDPTLLFTTAGMVQFKALYAGAPLPFSKATTVQKCLRAGGKGSDLEKVGKTLRHHTFFEMLGNFSFGDYFKEEAIDYAWEFIFDVLNMEMDRLWVSVFEDDDETLELWVKKGFPRERIVRLGKEDNFWGPAGDEGACGPCTEIHFDLGEEYSCGKETCQVGCDCERYLEFWNLVFPQFYQEKDGSRRPLERKGVDTGMGLERLSFLMDKEAKNNYQTELFRPIISAIEELSGIAYSSENASFFHVIADHIRALVFSIGDGVLPSNEGRGYVIRRILRRGIRFGRKLNLVEPFLIKLVPIIFNLFKEAYPDLKQNLPMIEKVIQNEEERFLVTLNRGFSFLETMIKEVQDEGKSLMDGERTFKLYDTYGLPMDIIEEVLEEHDLQVDQDGFSKRMKEQKEMGKRSWKGTSYTLDTIEEELEGVLPTKFLGYELTQIDVPLEKVIYEGASVDQLKDGEEGILVFKESPFYGESGGQEGDHGLVLGPQGKGQILDTQKSKNGVFLHHVKVLEGSLQQGETYSIEVDPKRRRGLRQHHTATHLLQAALRKVLGEHVKQAGSSVSEDRLRFDFSHPEKVSLSELEEVEQMVNLSITQNKGVQVEVLSLEEVQKRDDVLANFGDKYGESVRMISAGPSKELCGGTHVDSTGDIGGFHILNESSVAAGIRRIEAVCGSAFLTLAQNNFSLVNQVTRSLSVSPKEILPRIKVLQDKIKQLEKENAQLKKGGSQQMKPCVEINETFQGLEVILLGFKELDPKSLMSILDKIKSEKKSYCLLLGTVFNDKIHLISSRHGTDKVNCSNLIREVSSVCGGKGGGKPDQARGGGSDLSAFDKVFDKALLMIRDVLGE